MLSCSTFLGSGKDQLNFDIQSLVKAAEMPDDPLLRATCLILFFGVPHKGLDVADIRNMIPADHPRQALLSQINLNSPQLANLLSWFKITIGERKVISFYERKQTRELKEVCSPSILSLSVMTV